LVFIMNYFREYSKLRRIEIVSFSYWIFLFNNKWFNWIKQAKAIDPSSGTSLREDNNYLGKPRYLESFTQNNSPRYDWGPKKRINHYGLYSHLNTSETNDEVALNALRTSGGNGFLNQSFHEDNISNKSGVIEILDERF
jgi:hypothetical protein